MDNNFRRTFNSCRLSLNVLLSSLSPRPPVDGAAETGNPNERAMMYCILKLFGLEDTPQRFLRWSQSLWVPWENVTLMSQGNTVFGNIILACNKRGLMSILDRAVVRMCAEEYKWEISHPYPLLKLRKPVNHSGDLMYERTKTGIIMAA